MLKNITLSAEEELIQKARQKARQEHTTLNKNFRQWLNQYISNTAKPIDFVQYMDTLKYVAPGKKFSREELNER